MRTLKKSVSRYSLLQNVFGQSLADVVQQLSKIPKEGYVERLLRAEWRVLIIKACDRLDNLRSLDRPGVPHEFIARQAAETREKYLSVFDRMVSCAPYQWLDGSKRIQARILEELTRLEKTLAEAAPPPVPAQTDQPSSS